MPLPEMFGLTMAFGQHAGTWSSCDTAGVPITAKIEVLPTHGAWGMKEFGFACPRRLWWEPFNGRFLWARKCPAFQSKRRLSAHVGLVPLTAAEPGPTAHTQSSCQNVACG